MATEESSQPNAVEKALSVLETVASPGAPHRLAEISTRVSLPKSTVHRILQVLGREGYVTASSEGSYSIGPRALALAGQVLAHSDIRVLAEPILSELQRATGATVHFAVRSGTTAVYIAKFEGDQPYRMASRVGSAIPLHCTSIGKAILAALPADEARRMIETMPLVARTPSTRTTVASLLADLDEARQRGFAIDDEENERSVRCVGAAVRDSLGAVIGGVSISSLAFQFALDDAMTAGPHVHAAATAVSEALGATGEHLAVSVA
jgi:IclR family acetate operon transcriptional repressor